MITVNSLWKWWRKKLGRRSKKKNIFIFSSPLFSTLQLNLFNTSCFSLAKLVIIEPLFETVLLAISLFFGPHKRSHEENLKRTRNSSVIRRCWRRLGKLTNFSYYNFHSTYNVNRLFSLSLSLLWLEQQQQQQRYGRERRKKFVPKIN